MTIEIVNYSKTKPQIENFSKERYIDRSYMEKEWEDVWKKSWLLAGLESDLEKPGDFFVFDMGREQILVTKMENSQNQGFFNVCQHRGNRLVNEERGHAANFRCAYHAWTYNINGDLAVVPYKERFLSGEPGDDRAMKKVHTRCWNGFVFVSLAENPLAFEDFLGPLNEILSPYNFSEMTLVEDQTALLDCNWKAVIDNFSELYHVDFLHPQHKRMVDCCNDTVRLFEHGHTGVEVPGGTVSPRFPIPEMPTDIQAVQLESVGLSPADFKGKVLEIREALQKQKRKIGPERGMDYSKLADHQLSDVWQYNIFPNVVLSFTPEHCWVLRPRPHPSDPSKCEFDKMSLVKFADKDAASDDGAILSPGRREGNQDAFLAEDYVRPNRDTFSYQAVINGNKTMTDTIDQDVELLSAVQQGMTSDGFDTVFLNEDEMRIQHFHNYINQAMG